MAIESFAKRTRPLCHFLGGSNARAIMIGDKVALTRSWTADHSRAQAAKAPTAVLQPVRGNYSRATSHTQRQTPAKLTTFIISVWRLMKAQAILWHKFYACFSKYTVDQGNRVLVPRVSDRPRYS
jgi:hypothetical protein